VGLPREGLERPDRSHHRTLLHLRERTLSFSGCDRPWALVEFAWMSPRALWRMHGWAWSLEGERCCCSTTKHAPALAVVQLHALGDGIGSWVLLLRCPGTGSERHGDLRVLWPSQTRFKRSLWTATVLDRILSAMH